MNDQLNKCMFRNVIYSENQEDSISFCMHPFHRWKECTGNCLLTPEQIFSIIQLSKQKEQKCQQTVTMVK